MEYKSYVAVWLTRDEILKLRELTKQLEPPMQNNLSHRLGASLLRFGSPVYELKVEVIEDENN